MQQENYTIAEMANSFGVSLRTLRFYEQRGLLQPARVGLSRYYSARDRIVIELILKGKRLGFTLMEIERLLAFRRPSEKTATYDIGTHGIAMGLTKEQIIHQIEILEKKRNSIDVALTELKAARDDVVNNQLK